MKLIRKIFGGISLTAAMFVFQACYGTPEWEDDCYGFDVNVRVLSADDNSPIPGIRVFANFEAEGPINYMNGWGSSDSAGFLQHNVCPMDGAMRLIFEDENKIYKGDTLVFEPVENDTVQVFLKKAE
ncbi:MAG: hypothetical protein IJK99_00235 [Bacteroidales bacterium]|nr:hypothetical protein [Bacteroidales bacterium]